MRGAGFVKRRVRKRPRGADRTAGRVDLEHREIPAGLGPALLEDQVAAVMRPRIRIDPVRALEQDRRLALAVGGEREQTPDAVLRGADRDAAAVGCPCRSMRRQPKREP